MAITKTLWSFVRFGWKHLPSVRRVVGSVLAGGGRAFGVFDAVLRFDAHKGGLKPGQLAVAWFGCAVLFCVPGVIGETFPSPRLQPGADLFQGVQRIQIDLGANELDSLRKDPRKKVSATVHDGHMDYRGVEIHLKGSSSFRAVDDKPGLTLSFGDQTGASLFHGLRKIHLNNSVEDPGYLNEHLGHDLFRAAGLPAPRAGYALVELNGRKLGLYVLKEGFTEDFLAGYFADTRGNIYEAEFGHDVDQPMKRNSGRGTKQDQSDREKLAAAALDPDVRGRWEHLERVLDTDQFLKFMVTEVMICHRDGYCLARNNFRIYHDLASDRVLFLPHGMDQLFGKADFLWQPHMAGIVAAGMMDTPEGKHRYATQFPALFNQVFQVDQLIRRVDELLAELRPVLPHGDFAEIQREAQLVKERIINRHASLQRQLTQPPIPGLTFAEGSARVKGWIATDAPIRGKLDEITTHDGIRALHIGTQGTASASWRSKVMLARGNYRFQGAAMISHVQPLPFGNNQGAGLRVSGRSRGENSFIGDSTWRTLQTEFQVESDNEEIELVCELRASTGDAWFDAASLSISKISALTALNERP